VCKAGSEHVQALEDAQSSETKASAEDGEESVEEDRRPAEFGNYTDNERRIEQKSIEFVRSRMMTWKMMSRLATTAQKTPAG
jgi:hypothetical protein